MRQHWRRRDLIDVALLQIQTSIWEFINTTVEVKVNGVVNEVLAREKPWLLLYMPAAVENNDDSDMPSDVSDQASILANGVDVDGMGNAGVENCLV
ncbi:hypothetical protein RIF29_28600 [Crotalaria pallida]|uniref:Uncharacterized protein n=1 Tax=Crotalaria pallida TaxID=3830 RepID=A0AAN9EFC4_CROPI